MRVDIKTSGFDLTEGLRDHAQRRLEFALDRASQTLERRLCRLRDTAINHGRSLSRISQQSDSVAI